MVQIFSVHQQSVQHFAFSSRLCQILQVNHLVLMDVPFITIALLIVLILRKISKVANRFIRNLC